MECRVLSCGGAKGRHAKTRKSHQLAGFRVATFRPAMQRCDKQGRKGERSPRENPPNGDFLCFRMATFRPARQRYDKQEAKRRRMKSVLLSCGGAKGRHAKTRKSHHLAGFRVAPFRLFAPKTRLHDMAQISHHTQQCFAGRGNFISAILGRSTESASHF